MEKEVKNSVTRSKLFLIALCVLAAIPRFVNFQSHLLFLDDQGRDAVVVKRILINHDVTLLGPRTSVGDMFLGPLYYYAMVPFLAMTYPNPVGPALAIAILGVITTLLVYKLGSEMVGKRAAGVAAVLFTSAPWVISLSRFSWQPNPAPFVGLLLMYFLYRGVKEHKLKWWFAAEMCVVVLLQLHYVALLSGLSFLIVYLFSELHLARKKARQFFKNTFIVGAAGFFMLFVSQLPLIAFDLRHDGIIRKGFSSFSREMSSQTSHTAIEKMAFFIEDVQGIGMRLMVELLGFSKEQRFVNLLLLGAVSLASILVVVQSHHRNRNKEGVLILVSFLVPAIIGLTLYRNNIHEHYFAYLFPTVFLFVGLLLDRLMSLSKFLIVPVLAIVITGVSYNLLSLPYWKPSQGMTMNDMKAITEMVLEKNTDLGRYNVSLLNDNREYRAMKYRYFFEVSSQPPLDEYSYSDLDTLIVIVENNEQPLDAPIYEIQSFLKEVESAPHTIEKMSYNDEVVQVYVMKKER
jgi:4-amino-4-deoxy-L-arabinose transferase-like glycosyltransferase